MCPCDDEDMIGVAGDVDVRGVELKEEGEARVGGNAKNWSE
jgi:hypothetical protein